MPGRTGPSLSSLAQKAVEAPEEAKVSTTVKMATHDGRHQGDRRAHSNDHCLNHRIHVIRLSKKSL